MDRGVEKPPPPASASSAASAASAYEWILGLLDAVDSGPHGHRTRRQCPAHDDESPSLSVAAGEGGRALLHCHAGCKLEEILTALRIGERHLYQASVFSPEQHVRICHPDLTFPAVRRPAVRASSRRSRRSGGGPGAAFKFESTHDYGKWCLVRYRHPATGEKSLEWEHRGADQVWLPGLGGARLNQLPLYQEDQIHHAVGADEVIVVCESESSEDALNKVGMYATTWAGGASQPQLDTLVRVLAGARVVVVPDHDEAGLPCGQRVMDALEAAGARVSLVVPDVQGQDARDLLAQRGLAAFAL